MQAAGVRRIGGVVTMLELPGPAGREPGRCCSTCGRAGGHLGRVRPPRRLGHRRPAADGSRRSGGRADWPGQVRSLTGGGADAAVNAARSGAQDAMRTVRDGGQLATITRDPPTAQRGIAVTAV